MKKWFITVMILFASFAQTQTYVDCPRLMVKDTLYLRTQTTIDLYYNAENSYGLGKPYAGPVDFQIIPCIASDSDSLTIEVYGILKTLTNRSTAYTTTYVDSHNVVTNLVIDGLPHIYAIDPLWADFPIFDGLHYVIKKNGSDVDSDSIFVRQRIWPQGGN